MARTKTEHEGLRLVVANTDDDLDRTRQNAEAERFMEETQRLYEAEQAEQKKLMASLAGSMPQLARRRGPSRKRLAFALTAAVGSFVSIAWLLFSGEIIDLVSALRLR